MAKGTVVEKSNKIRLLVHTQDSATIFRPHMPFICDKPEKAVEWLAANGHKPENIIVEGETPLNWDSVFASMEKEIVTEPAKT